MKTILGAIVVAMTIATPVSAQDNPWNWKQAVARGKTVEIRNVIGDIVVTRANGSEVEVVARKTARSSDPRSVNIVANEHSDGVVICAIYDGDSDCEPDHGSHGNVDDNDTRVEFEVRLPAGVHLKAKNVTGDVEATNLASRVNASSVSGSVNVSTTDIARASTVSGSVRVKMGRSDWDGTLSFSTVSGNIDLEIAGDLNADVAMTTVSGSFDSDWPLSVSSGGRRQMRGTVGSGGRRLTFSTVSGDVEIRKAP